MTINAIRTLETRAVESYSARIEDIAIFRVLLAAFILCNVVPIAAWLPLAPRAFFSPPIGPAALFTGPPPAVVMLGLNCLLVLFVAMLLVGWKTGLASAGTGLTFIALKSWDYSLGKISHDIFIGVTPLVLGFSGWGRTFSIDSSSHPQIVGGRAAAWPLALLALLVGFAMFNAGLAKATTGWLDPQLRCTYGHLVLNYLQTGRETWAASWALRIDSTWFWKLTDWSAVLLEVAFLPAAIHRWSFRLVLAVSSFFHVGVMFLFGIPFSGIIAIYAAFVSTTAHG
jgi:Vitamin K-dependent gamma-carboxylase